MARQSRVFFSIAVSLSLAAASAYAQSGDVLFDQNCSICHQIGGSPSADAPDLKGVTARLDRAWLVRFVLDPEGVTKGGDAYAVALAARYGGTVMPPPEGLTRESVDAILSYVEQRSGGAPAAALPGAPAVAQAPTFTADEVARGRALYAGDARLSARGPSCFACHEAAVAPPIGSGALGPSLAGVSARLKGAKGVATWLTNPPTPVMRTTYRAAPLAQEEARALAAFFGERDMAGGATASPRAPAALRFVSLAAGVTALGFAAIGATWRRRFRAVRRPLVLAAARRNTPRSHDTTRQGFRSGGLR